MRRESDSDAEWKRLCAQVMTGPELAELLRLSRQRVGQLEQAGVLMRTGGGGFPMVECLHRYMWFRFGPAPMDVLD